MRRPKHITAKQRTRAAYVRMVIRRVVSEVVAVYAQNVEAALKRYQADCDACLAGVGPWPVPR